MILKDKASKITLNIRLRYIRYLWNTILKVCLIGPTDSVIHIYIIYHICIRINIINWSSTELLTLNSEKFRNKKNTEANHTS